MNINMGGFFNFSDRVAMSALDHRVRRNDVLSSNVSNSETPGFRAIGYDFEEQLAEVYNKDEELALTVSDPKHLRHAFASADGTVIPDVFVRPSESVNQDGNTVDIDQEMGDLAQNQILFRATVEALNKKIAMLKYAIHGGRG